MNACMQISFNSDNFTIQEILRDLQSTFHYISKDLNEINYYLYVNRFIVAQFSVNNIYIYIYGEEEIGGREKERERKL